ncbi:MAG: hypothetical protein LIO81_06000 [Clostridiales bacterium]|nr:hypothetical protein [Clostridiales bacterium]
MVIQELFQQAEINHVEEAYFLQHTFFEPYEKHSLDEKVDAVMRIKEYIREHIIHLATCNISIEEPQTVFIVELPCECYEDKGKTELTLFSIFDQEAYQKVRRDFALWGEDREYRIERYGIDMSKPECIAGYHIAKKSVETLGTTACCVEILHELFTFGYSDESREKNLQKLYERIKEAEEDIAEEKLYSYEEVFEQLWEEMLRNCKNTDEREHMLLKREYESKVKEIERRYTQEIMKANHKKIIALIREEYGMSSV